MTPSLYSGTEARDEYGLVRTPGGTQRLRDHHRTFITEADFAWLAQHGVAVVRIPVGYWVLDGDGGLPAAVDRLDWAFAMGKRYRIAVLVCLHGAPGSQNGNDHSGRVGPANWQHRPDHQEKTVAIVKRLTQRYVDHPAWWGIQLLNEPTPRLINRTVRRFYRRCYQELSPIMQGRGVIVYSDAFRPRRMASALRAHRQGQTPITPVLMDIHWYHFTYDWHRVVPLGWYLRRVVPGHGRLLARLMRRGYPVMVGEWSAVLAGPVLGTSPADQHTSLQLQHLQRQQDAYQPAIAQFYWSYRTEEGGPWSYRWVVEQGWIDTIRK